MTFNLISRIFSWNLQSTDTVTGSKFDDPDFCKIFDSFSFVCLQEIRQPVKYPGYRAFNNTRSDKKHGGVCILVANEISRGVKFEKTSIEDVVACKLDKNFFDLESDLFIVNSYIKPANSSLKNSEISGFDIMHDLDQFLNSLTSMAGGYNYLW